MQALFFCLDFLLNYGAGPGLDPGVNFFRDPSHRFLTYGDGSWKFPKMH